MNLNFTFRKTLLLFLCSVLLSLFTFAQKTFTGVSGGNWNVGSNWSGGTIPTALEDVLIPDGKNVLVNTAAECKSLTIQTGPNSNFVTIEGTNSLLVDGAITFGAITADDKTKSISVGTGSLQAGSVSMVANGDDTRKSAISVLSGDVTITGNISMTGAALQNSIGATGPGIINLGGQFTGTGGLNMNAASTFNYNGTAAQTVKIAPGFTYGNLTLNNTSVPGATLQGTITATNVTGDLSIQSGLFKNGGHAITLASSKSFTVEGDATFLLTGTSKMVTVSGSGSKSFSPTSTVQYFGGNQDISAETYGNLSIAGTGSKELINDLTVNGNFSVTSSSVNLSKGGGPGIALAVLTLNGNFTHTGGELTTNGNSSRRIDFSGTSEQIFTSGGTIGGNNQHNIDFVVKNGATLQTATPSTTIIGRSFVIENGGTLGIKSSNGINTTAGSNPTAGNIQTEVRTYGAGANYIYNGTVNQIAGDGLTQNTPKDLFIENPNFVVSLSNPTNISGNLIIRSGTLNAANNNISLGGSWLNFGTGFSSGTGSVIFNGTGVQNIGGATITTFNNLDINKGSGSVSLGQDLNVNGALRISQNLNLGTYNLTLGSASPAIETLGISSFNGNKMIIASGGGELRKILPANAAGQTYQFPVGDNIVTAEYSPVNLSFTSGTSANGYVAVKLADAKHPNNGHLNSYLTRYWTITQNGLSAFSAIAEFTYVDADIVGTEANIRLGKWDGQGPWTRYSATSINVAENKLISEPLTSFSDFTGLDFLEVLPINYGGLRGWNINATSNGIEWKVFDETGTSHYEVEKMQGGSFAKIGSVEAGNSGLDATYSFTDQHANAGDNFYRIKGVEFTGEITYSPVIRVRTGSNGATALKVYPNPAQGNNVSISLQNMKAGKYQLIITNMQGQRVHNTILNHAGGTSVQTINVNNLQKGIYRLQISGHEESMITGFIKE